MLCIGFGRMILVVIVFAIMMGPVWWFTSNRTLAIGLYSTLGLLQTSVFIWWIICFIKRSGKEE